MSFYLHPVMGMFTFILIYSEISCDIQSTPYSMNIWFFNSNNFMKLSILPTGSACRYICKFVFGFYEHCDMTTTLEYVYRNRY